MWKETIFRPLVVSDWSRTFSVQKGVMKKEESHTQEHREMQT